MTHTISCLAVILGAYFFLGWLISYKTNKYAWIDFFWSSSFLAAIVFVFPKDPSGPHALMVLMMAAWSARLSYLLFTRIVKESEDPRYVKLKSRWSDQTARNFLILYLFQAALTLVLCLPLYIASLSPDTGLDIWNYIGAGLFALFLFGEGLSDYQLLQFKKQNAGQRKVCDIGLWNYSRHPNYFFEVMIWFSYGVFSIGSAYPILAFVPFAVMYLFITKITGIPYAEAQSIESRGHLYREYQNRTSQLFPWFPKESK